MSSPPLETFQKIICFGKVELPFRKSYCVGSLLTSLSPLKLFLDTSPPLSVAKFSEILVKRNCPLYCVVSNHLCDFSHFDVLPISPQGTTLNAATSLNDTHSLPANNREDCKGKQSLILKLDVHQGNHCRADSLQVLSPENISFNWISPKIIATIYMGTGL